MDKHTSEPNNLAIYWRNKLDWYLNEATVEEYDEEEVLAIKSILDIIESEKLDENYYNPEQGWERFKATLDMRMKIQDEMKKTRDKMANRKRFAFKTNGLRKVAMAASLVLTLVVGGTVGAYAHKEGIFSNFKDNKEELHAAVNPSVDSVKYLQTFENFEKFPMQYLPYVWAPTGIPGEVKLKMIELVQEEAAVSIRCEYFNQETKQFVNATKKTFVDKAAITNRIYDGFEAYKDEKYNSIEVRYLQRINEDYTEYIVLFVNKNSIYVINSNCGFETIENIISKNIIDGNL